MASVVDASLVLAVALREPRSARVAAVLRGLHEQGDGVLAPHLIRYEVASGLTRAVARGRLSLDQAVEAELALELLNIEVVDGAEDISRLVILARQLQRSNAYDAAYFLLAQELGAELWTLDGPLYRNALAIGAPVRLVE